MIEQIKREYLKNGNAKLTAQVLKLNERTVRRYVNLYGINTMYLQKKSLNESNKLIKEYQNQERRLGKTLPLIETLLEKLTKRAKGLDPKNIPVRELLNCTVSLSRYLEDCFGETAKKYPVGNNIERAQIINIHKNIPRPPSPEAEKLKQKLLKEMDTEVKPRRRVITPEERAKLKGNNRIQ